MRRFFPASVPLAATAVRFCTSFGQAPQHSSQGMFPRGFTVQERDPKALAALLQRHGADERYVAQIAACQTWAEAAPVESAMHKGETHRLPALLATQRPLIECEGGTTVATHHGDLATSCFVPCVEVDIKQHIAQRGAMFNDTIPFLDISPATVNVLNRHIVVDSCAVVQEGMILAVLQAQLKLAVLTGPSGSGKTTTMFAACQKFGHPILYYARKSPDIAAGTSELRDEAAVGELAAAMRDALRDGVNKRYDGPVVLIVDDLGSSPNFLKAMCSLFKRDDGLRRTGCGDVLCQQLRDAAQATQVLLVVGGTGCDSPSYPVRSTYTLVKLGDAFGHAVLQSLLHKSPKLHVLLKLFERRPRSFTMRRIQRAALNPRVAAAFVAEAKKLRWVHCDWPHAVKPILDVALHEFFIRSALNELTADQRTAVFGEALAVSLGGARQSLAGRELLSTTYGLIVDNAFRVNKCRVNPAEHVQIDRDADVAAGDDVLVVTRGSQRYSLQPSTVEMMLRNTLGPSTHREPTGAGFEAAMSDVVLVQLLAGASGVPVAPLEGDPLEELKRMIRSAASGAQALLTVKLSTAAMCPWDAFCEVRRRVKARLESDMKHLLEDERGNPRAGAQVKFVAVTRNRDLTPAADTFVISATIQRTARGTWKHVDVETDFGGTISLQYKHHTTAPMCEHEVKAEFFKMGHRETAYFAAFVANRVSKEVAQDASLLQKFIRGVAGKVNARVIRPMREEEHFHLGRTFSRVTSMRLLKNVCFLVQERQFWRQALYQELQKIIVVTHTGRSTAARDRCFLVALAPTGRIQKTFKEPQFVLLENGSTTMSRSLLPITLREMPASGSTDSYDDDISLILSKG